MLHPAVADILQVHRDEHHDDGGCDYSYSGQDAEMNKRAAYVGAVYLVFRMIVSAADVKVSGKLGEQH